MKTVLAMALLLTVPQVFGAWGVSESSVKKWDAKKLCVKNAELEIKKDWKAVAIITKEIASRPSLDLEACEKISKSTQSKLTGEKSKRRKRDIDEAQLAVLDQIVKDGLEEFGVPYLRNLVRGTCNKEEFDRDLKQDYKNYVVASVPFATLFPARNKNYTNLIPLAANRIEHEAQGFSLALTLASSLAPDLCSDAGIDGFDRLIDSYVAAKTQPATNQNVDFTPEVGQGKKEVLKEIGEPILVENIGAISAEHYCRTLDLDEGGDDFLVLYFLNDSLLYSHRYKGPPDTLTDCAELAGQGGYELPETIKSIVGSSSK